MKKQLFWLFFFILAAASLGSCQETSFSKKEDLILIVPGAPDGGWAALARSIKTVMEKEQLTSQNIQIVYKQGDGGEEGWKLLQQFPSGQAVAMTSSLIFTNELLGHSQLSYQEFTPVALMASEWQSVIVRSDSAVSSIAELMNRLRLQPDVFPVGIEPQFGNDDQIAFIQAAKSNGIPPASIRFFRYASGEQLLAALQKGEIAAASLSSSQSIAFAQTNNVRIIAISSEHRLPQLPNVPTWKEQGINVVYPHWRGVIGSGGMSKQAEKQWSKWLADVAASPYWKEELRRHHWTPFYRNSQDTAAFFQTEMKKYQFLMNQK